MGICNEQVKKVPGVGAPADSCVVDGVACRKNLAHKRMARRIADARILMIAGTLEFGRAQGRLASLDSFTKEQVRPCCRGPGCHNKLLPNWVTCCLRIRAAQNCLLCGSLCSWAPGHFCSRG
jgi:hypothetical protein